MPITRVHKTKDFTVMSNAHFRERKMSLKTKGLLSLMLSLPDDWDYSIAGLVKLSKDGKDSVMGALNELEQFGYLRRTKTYNNKKQFSGYDYDIYETPLEMRKAEFPQSEYLNTEKPYTEKPYAKKPYTEKPYAENPNTENPPQYNTKELNTNKLNTKQLNIKEIKDIVDYLNAKANTSFRSTTKSTQQHIHARLEEGFIFNDFKIVINKKCAEWIGTEFEQYLRPQTLFGTKFESYLNAPAPIKRQSQIAATTEELPDDVKRIFGEL